MPLTSPALSARAGLVHAFSTAQPRDERRWAAAAAEAGAPGLGVARVRQVHGDTVVHADRPGDAGEADALWTDRPGLLVAIVTADCVPVLVAGDGVVAAIHAGWRGVAAGVIPAALEALSGRGPLVAAIGPCIRPAVYETGEAVVDAIVGVGVPDAVVADRSHGRAHADIAAAAAWQLRAGGCAVVHDGGWCTFTDHRFASYRRQGGAAGRQVSLIGMRR